MKRAFLFMFLVPLAAAAFLFVFSPQELNALECSWTQYEYRCTEGYWSSEYQCTWYDDPPQTYCQPSTKTETQCGFEYECTYNESTGNEDCGFRYVCREVVVPSENCTTTDPPPYKSCEWMSVWNPGSCGNYPTYKTQTCPADSETSCSYATDCSTSGSKNVTSYSCGSSGCQSSTTPATCTRTFPTCTNNVGETGNICGGSCTAPPDKTLSVTVSANPSSGKAPLKNVQIDASVGGTATGTITYKLDCTNDGAFDDSATSSSTSFTFTKKCDYLAAGSYTAMVEVTRQTLKASNTAGVTVTQACDSTSFTACSNAKDFGSGGAIGAMCGGDQYYQAVVPAGNTCDVLFSVTPDSSSDYDLYVENTAAACPATNSWDCKSTNGTGVNDQCTSNLGPGTYKALVHKYSGSGIYSVASSVYSCKPIGPTYPTNTWQRLWYDDPKTKNFSSASFLGEGPNQSAEQFDENWVNGVVAYGKSDQIGFKASRTIDFTGREGTYFVSVGHDDGARLYIDGNLVINSWIDTDFQENGYKIEMTSGPHTFLLEYYENTGNAHVSFSLPFAVCKKVSTPYTNTATVNIPSAEGTRACEITFTHAGQDLSDGSAVKYERIDDNSAPATTIEMDDTPTTSKSCDLDLEFYTDWTPNPLAPGYVKVRSYAKSKNAASDLLWNYTLNTSTATNPAERCIIKKVASNQDCLGDAAYGSGSGDKYACALPTINSTVEAVKKHGIRRNYGSTEPNQVHSNFNFNLVECTLDAQCTYDTNKTRCNVDANDDGIGDVTTNFPTNTCMDSKFPSTKITGLTSSSPGTARGDKSGAVWLRGRDDGGNRIYTVSAEFKDEGNAGLQSCNFALLKGTSPTPTTVLTSSQSCSGTSPTIKTFTFSVGPTGDCNIQDDDNCTIWVWGTDRAGNNEATTLNRKLTTSLQEKSYLDSSASFTDRVNYLQMGVDYTPPTAQ